jgi:hypothetical protein
LKVGINTTSQDIEHNSIDTEHSFKRHIIQQVHLSQSKTSATVQVTKKQKKNISALEEPLHYTTSCKIETHQLTNDGSDGAGYDIPSVTNNTSQLSVSTS